MRNLFCNDIGLLPFQTALIALLTGKPIRRKSERQGYIKTLTITGELHKETFGTYWMSDPDSISNYCTFSIDDILASDWMIDATWKAVKDGVK